MFSLGFGTQRIQPPSFLPLSHVDLVPSTTLQLLPPPPRPNSPHLVLQGLTIVFCKGPESNHFQLCRLYDLCCNYSALRLKYESSPRQYPNRWLRLCSSKIAFILKRRQIWSASGSLLTPEQVNNIVFLEICLTEKSVHLYYTLHQRTHLKPPMKFSLFYPKVSLASPSPRSLFSLPFYHKDPNILQSVSVLP